MGGLNLEKMGSNVSTTTALLVLPFQHCLPNYSEIHCYLQRCGQMMFSEYKLLRFKHDTQLKRFGLHKVLSALQLFIIILIV